MIGLQIYGSKEYPPILPHIMKSVKDKLDDYILICDPEGNLHKDIGAQPISFEETYVKVVEFFGNREWLEIYCKNNILKGDCIRLYYAIQYPDLLYADSDVQLNRLISMQIGTPYIASRDYFLFYVNGACDFFRKVVDISFKQKPDYLVFTKTIKMLTFANKCGRISRDSYIRHFLWKREWREV